MASKTFRDARSNAANDAWERGTGKPRKGLPENYEGLTPEQQEALPEARVGRGTDIHGSDAFRVASSPEGGETFREAQASWEERETAAANEDYELRLVEAVSAAETFLKLDEKGTFKLKPEMRAFFQDTIEQSEKASQSPAVKEAQEDKHAAHRGYVDLAIERFPVYEDLQQPEPPSPGHPLYKPEKLK